MSAKFPLATRGAIRTLDWILPRYSQLLRAGSVSLNSLKIARANLISQGDQSGTVIATYPRSGTTWMQMILFQLAGGGDLEAIDHIDRVVPSVESVLLQQGSLAGVHQRIFHAHLPYHRLPKGCGKYIHVVRHGMDVAISHFHHFRRYNNTAIAFDAFFDRFLVRGALYPQISWFSHTRSFLKNSSGLPILVVRYEDLIRDLPVQIKRVASFCDISIDEARLSAIVSRCSFDYMRKHEIKFDPVPNVNYRRGDRDSHFIRRGTVGTDDGLITPSIARLYEGMCKRYLGRGPLADYCRLSAGYDRV